MRHLNRIKLALLGVSLSVVLLPATALALPSAGSTSSLPVTETAALLTRPDVCQNRLKFLGLEPWYHFLTNNFSDGKGADKAAGLQKCDIKCFNVVHRGTPNDCGRSTSDIPLVMLAVVDDLLRVAGLAAVGFVIYGAFQYVASEGDAEKTGRAKATIVNALVGMVVATIAVPAVAYLGHRLGGS